MKTLTRICLMQFLYFFLSLFLISTAFADSNAGITIDTQANAIIFASHYEVFNGVADTWDAAEQYCESLGGHLATISSQSENDTVYSIVEDSGCSSAYFGFSDRDREGTWTWVNGESTVYTNWASGEPNSENANEDYAMFYFKFTDGTWNDGDFGGSTVSGGTAFICEWDTDEAYESYLGYSIDTPCIYYTDLSNQNHSIELPLRFEDIVFSTASTTYNPKLAYYLSALSCAAYDRVNITQSLKSLGFENIFLPVQYYNYDKYAAFSFSTKELEDGSTLVLIVVRGTFGEFPSPEWVLTDFDVGLDTLAKGGYHDGFAESTQNLLTSLRKYLQGIDTANATYVVTGHSLGAAVANLTSYTLLKSGVDASSLFNYNFACPDVVAGYEWHNDENYTNMFNIADVRDLVSVVPGVLGDVLQKNGIWGKYGKSRWFAWPDESIFIDSKQDLLSHDLSNYIRFFSKEPSFASFMSHDDLVLKRLTYRLLGIHCPVDVVIYDSLGNPIADVVNGEYHYYDSIIGDVIIVVNGDEKVILIPNDKEYDVTLIGTGEGKLTYEVYEANLASSDLELKKSFNSVELTSGKKMSSTISGDASAEDIRLFVVDDTGMRVHEILTDGTEVEIDESILSEGIWNNLAWKLTKNGLLSISGNGEMGNLYSNPEGTWRPYKDSIKYVVIQSGITNIGIGAFSSCSNLESVIIPASVLRIENRAFSSCDKLPAVIIPLGVKYIGQGAFEWCTCLTSVKIPSSVTIIDIGAFSFCSSLPSVEIPASVTNIDVCAFSWCGKMTNIFVDASNKNYCDIDGVLFDKSKTSIVCFPCGRTGSYTIPINTKSIYDDAFYSCQGLKKVFIPMTVTSIGDSAFSNCSNLTEITIPSSVTSIGDSAFNQCGLINIVIPQSMTSIGEWVFSHCNYLSDVTIPTSIKSIGRCAFNGCSKLADVYYQGTTANWAVIHIDEYNEPLLKATIHSNYLPSPDLILPLSLINIESEAFVGSAFVYAKLPDKAVSIGWRAFANCPNLAYIYIPASTTQIDDEAFGNMQGLTIIGKTGTTAETYAQNHHFTFIAVP